VSLPAGAVYAPDLLWYGNGPIDECGRPYPIPDLAVEVRSPSTWRYDLGTKKANCERYGLRELWLVDTNGACVLVYRRSRPDAHTFDVELELSREHALTSPLLPGFALALEELFGSGRAAAG